MMELVKKHIHMNRRSGSVASQMTLDDDFNVRDGWISGCCTGRPADRS